jgi:hypothetical protein
VEGVPEVGARDVLLAVLGGHGLDGRGRVRDEIEVDGEVGLADGEKLAQRPGLDSDPLGPHLRDDLFGPVITEAQINVVVLVVVQVEQVSEFLQQLDIVRLEPVEGTHEHRGSTGASPPKRW